jgi:hypothetical protein
LESTGRLTVAYSEFIPLLIGIQNRFDTENINFSIDREYIANIIEDYTENETANFFVKLKNEIVSNSEKEGLEILFKMMIAIRQQIRLRQEYENSKMFYHISWLHLIKV